MSELKSVKFQDSQTVFSKNVSHVSAYLQKNDTEKQLSNELSRSKIERKLSIEYGINLKDSNKEQYLVALDESRGGIPIVMRIPPIIKGQEPTVIIDEKEELNLFETFEKGNYSLMRKAPEVEWIHESLQREGEKSLTGKLFVAALDWADRIVTSQVFDMNIKDEPERRSFVESAVTLFHKCVLLSKDEFERSKIIGEEITISKDRTDLGRPFVPSHVLER